MASAHRLLRPVPPWRVPEPT